MKSEFDVEKNRDVWSKRLKKFKKQIPEDIKDPIVDNFCEAISDIITESPSKTGLTKAGWVKPLREEGKDVPNLLGDDEEIPKDKREQYAKEGENNSYYFKELDTKRKIFVIEAVNANKGAMFQEYGDSQTQPSGILRKQSIELQKKAKDSIGKALKDLGDKK